MLFGAVSFGSGSVYRSNVGVYTFRFTPMLQAMSANAFSVHFPLLYYQRHVKPQVRNNKNFSKAKLKTLYQSRIQTIKPELKVLAVRLNQLAHAHI